MKDRCADKWQNYERFPIYVERNLVPNMQMIKNGIQLF